MIPATSAGLAIAAIVELNPANNDLKRPDWRYTVSFAQDHAFEYTVLATAVMVLARWFKDDIHAGAAALANATGIGRNSNRIECQAVLMHGFQHWPVFNMALSMVSNFRMHAVSASFFGLPAASRR